MGFAILLWCSLCFFCFGGNTSRGLANCLQWHQRMFLSSHMRTSVCPSLSDSIFLYDKTHMCALVSVYICEVVGLGHVSASTRTPKWASVFCVRMWSSCVVFMCTYNIICLVTYQYIYIYVYTHVCSWHLFVICCCSC